MSHIPTANNYAAIDSAEDDGRDSDHPPLKKPTSTKVFSRDTKANVSKPSLLRPPTSSTKEPRRPPKPSRPSKSYVISIIQWNIQSFNSNREQIWVLMKDTESPIVCLQETKLGDIAPNIGHDHSFYRSHPMPGQRAHGGTGILVNKSINCKVVQLNTILEANAIQIFNNKWITICSLYLEPTLETRLFDTNGHPRKLAVNDLQNLINQLYSHFILMGDFNAKHTLWGETTCDPCGNVNEDFIDQTDVILLNVGSPTRYDVVHNTCSAIDLSICSSSLALDFYWFVNDHPHGSDH